MSRIHEALKRAELERANGRTAATGGAQPGPQEIAVAVKAVQAETILLPRENKPAEPSDPAGHFRFEDLVARRQSHAEWSPDLETDVFDASQDGHGAEQFRTLRSRLYHLR